MADDLPLQPVLAQSPPLQTPEAVKEGTLPAIGETFGADVMNLSGAVSIGRLVNAGYANAHGGDAMVPYDKATAYLKANNYDASGVPKDGWSESAIDTEMQRQQNSQDARLAASRANLSSTTQFVVGLASGLTDPITLAAGPLLGRTVGAIEAPLAARLAIGAGEGAGITAGEEALQNHLSGHDEDSLSWTMLRDVTLSAAPGALMHAAFGARPIARPGEKLTTENIDALERSEAAAKAQGVSVDDVISPTGAVGRHQVEPATARGLGLKGTDAEITEQLRNPEVNKEMSQKLLDQLARRYGNDPEAIAAAYNAGPRAADRWIAAGRDDSVLPRETQGYLSRLRGTPYQDRENAAKLAVAQLDSDSPVEVAPVADGFRTNPFAIRDEHENMMSQLHTQAMLDAVPQRDKMLMKDQSFRPITENEQEANPEVQTYNDAAKAAEDRVAGLGPEAQQTFRDNLAENEKVPEVGTLQHDEVTKGVTAAVQCGVMKGLQYGED